jgi:hypothetical protein
MSTNKTDKQVELYNALRKRYAEAIESENKKIIEQELEDATTVLLEHEPWKEK